MEEMIFYWKNLLFLPFYHSSIFIDILRYILLQTVQSNTNHILQAQIRGRDGVNVYLGHCNQTLVAIRLALVFLAQAIALVWLIVVRRTENGIIVEK